MTEAIAFQLERNGSYPVLRVSGEIDLATAPALDESLESIPVGVEPIIVDLSGVGFLDSSGLSVLIRHRQRFTLEDGGNLLRLVVTQDSVKRVLEVTGLADVFEIYDSVEGASAPR